MPETTDKTAQLVLDGLTRAAAEPAGCPLLGGKGLTGLFAATGPGRLAAQQCKDDGWLRTLRSETRGKASVEICAITEQGIAQLLAHVSPKQVLEELVRTLEARGQELSQLLQAAQNCQSSLLAIREMVDKVLTQLRQPSLPAPSRNGCADWKGAALAFLNDWSTTHPNDDCPLPTLFQCARQLAPHLTIGHFHDGLRQLHADGPIHLHPWTGPLHEIPEPALALMIGHAVAYYASRKNQG